MTKVILSEERKLFTKILHFVQNDSIKVLYFVKDDSLKIQDDSLPESRDTTGDLDYSLLKHCLCYLHEAGDVRTLHVVDVAVRLGSVLHASLMDVGHDSMELLINLGRAPADVHCGLGHCKT